MTDERIIAYLLKELPGEELERFEDECFAAEDWPSQISFAEEDLIDDYLRNELTPERRRNFELNYLTTRARMERVRVAAALLRHVDACAPAGETAAAPPVRKTWGERLLAWWGRPRMPRMAVALAVFALVVVGAWVIFRTPSAPKTFATLTLTVSHGDRAEGAQAGRVKLSPDVDALKVLLTLPDPPPARHYRAQLEDDKGAVKVSENVTQEAQSVPVTIPASQLARGRYALKLFAVKPDGTEQRVPGSYLFTVE